MEKLMKTIPQRLSLSIVFTYLGENILQMRCTYSHENIQSFCGINFADKILRNAGIYGYIGEILKSQDLRGFVAI